MTYPEDAGVAAELAKQDPKLKGELDRKRAAAQDVEYPKPGLGDIQNVWFDLQQQASAFVKTIQAERVVRYMRDEMPSKWKRHLETDRRVRSRLTHNEIMRVVAMICRNPYKVTSPAAGRDAIAQERAQKRQRWGQEFFPAMERATGNRSMRRVLTDAQVGDAMAYWEVYNTGSYEKLDLAQAPDESSRDYVKRTEKALMTAGSPIGLRALTAVECFVKFDDEGVRQALVVQFKPYRQVFSKLRDRLGGDALQEMRLPQPGDEGHGWASVVTNLQESQDTAGVGEGFTSTGTGDAVETIRYYDRRWYAYVVGGHLVEGPVEHKLPGCPIFAVPGLTTSSDQLHERYQGITWGMSDIELALNDQLTNANDVTITYGRPKPVIETDINGRPLMDPKNPKEYARIDLSDPSRAPQLGPGQHIVDAFERFQPKLPEMMVNTFFSLWQRSGRNPVAQGTSPGADPAGYTINSLIEGADDYYQSIIQNQAIAAGEVLDFVFKMIRDTLHERVYLPAWGAGEQQDEVEWLALDPEDIEDVPSRVLVDPTSEANRTARVQILTGGWKDGVVPRKVLQENGYGSEDPEYWDDLILQEQVDARLAAFLVDIAMQRVMAAVTPQTQQPAPGAGAPPSSPGGQSPAEDPSMHAPSVGAAGAPPRGNGTGAVTNGAGGDMNPARMLAGTNSGGYSPPASQAAPAG